MSKLKIVGKDAAFVPGIPVSDTEVLDVFTRKEDSAYYMRVKPVSYFLNSTMVQDKLAAGFVIVISLTTGTMYWIKGTELVLPVSEATIKVIK